MFNVCFASDDNYAAYLDIIIVSLLENNRFDDTHIYILDTEISDYNKEKIKKTCDKYNAHVSFLQVENIEDKLNISVNKMSVKGNLSLAFYSRLFLPSLLPKDVDKVLYLDCDGLVLDSFEPIWKLNLDEYYAAGVLALNCTEQMKKDLEMDISDKYINSGMLLVNLEAWRQNNIEEEFLNNLIYFSNKNVRFGMDQGVINSVLKGKILILNPEFNLEGSLHNTNYDITMKLNSNVQNGYYDKTTLDYAIQNPVFQHFCVGPGEFYNRPWLNPYHENKDIYEKYFKLSNFDKDEVYFYKKVPFIKRFNRFLPRNRITSFLIVKLIPDSICEKIINNQTIVTTDDVERW